MDQHIAHTRLLSAVVAMSIRDACLTSGDERFSGLARQAMDFLFLHSDSYLTLLDMDPQQFRRRLIDRAYDKDTDVKLFDLDAKDLRRFRSNYERWFELNEQTRSFA